MQGMLPEASRRVGGRQWWRYDQEGLGERPMDWAEMESSLTAVAEELAATAYDGLLGFSQGAEMVHGLALLWHQKDARLQGLTPVRFLVSLSGAVNVGHFEAASGPLHLLLEPEKGALQLPCLFVADFEADEWYGVERFQRTSELYADREVLRHGLRHAMPKQADPRMRRFLARFVRQR